MRAHGVDAEHNMVGLARRDADKAAIRAGFHRQVTAGRSEGELADNRLFALGLGVIRRQADTNDFRLIILTISKRNMQQAKLK